MYIMMVSEQGLNIGTAYVQSLLGHHHYVHFYQFIILTNNL